MKNRDWNNKVDTMQMILTTVHSRGICYRISVGREVTLFFPGLVSFCPASSQPSNLSMCVILVFVGLQIS